MRRALLAVCAVVLLASFANDASNKTILKDIDGTLLESYVVIDNDADTVTFTVDENTTVSSTVINGEFKVILIENGNSGNTISVMLELNDAKVLSFDHFFESSYDVASNKEVLSSIVARGDRPKMIIRD